MAETSNPLRADLDEVLSATGDIWDRLRGSRIFITGGTGFIGCWMLESLAHANDELGLGASAVVLTRDAARFARKAPHLAARSEITFTEGDLGTFEFPQGRFTHILHMAAETNTEMSNPGPSAYFDASVDGTRRVLALASASGVEQLLFTSSGAIYGPQPPQCAQLAEESGIAPEPESLAAAYGHGKRAAEFLCCAAHAETGLEAKIARCFAFVGPYLPLGSGFAIGNFIRDALAGRRIRVASDGSAIRSYLYAADLAAWLWTILVLGAPARPYNVGSEKAISIGELAGTVSQVLGGAGVSIEGTSGPATIRSRYVPDTSRVRTELGLRERIGLEAGIERTAIWNRDNRQELGK